jgi:hypothetical protein
LTLRPARQAAVAARVALLYGPQPSHAAHELRQRLQLAMGSVSFATHLRVARTSCLLLALSACAGVSYTPGVVAGLPEYNVPEGGN